MNDLLKVTGALVTLVCVSSFAENPSLNTRWPGPQDAPMADPKIALGDGVVYVADSAFGFRIVNVASAASPSIVSGFRAEWQPASIAQSGNMAAVADTNGRTIHLVDLSALRVTSTYEEANGITAIGLGESGLAIGNGIGEVMFVDVTSRCAPQLQSVFESIGPVASIEFNGTLAFVTSPGNGIDVVDISRLNAPQRVATYFRPQLKAATVSGNYLFAHIAPSSEEEAVALGIERWDVGDPLRPKFAGAFYPWNASRIERFSASGALALVSWVGATEYQRFHTIADFTGGGLAEAAGTFNRAGLIMDETIYSVSDGEFVVGQLTEPGVFTVVGRIQPRASALAVGFAGENAFVIERDGMTRVLDCASPGLPTVAQTGLGEDGLSVVTDGSFGYVRMQSGDVVKLDREGRFLARFDLPLGKLLVSDNRAYVLRDDTIELEVYDLSNLELPVLVGRCALRNLAKDAVFSEGILFVAEGQGGVEIIDAREPSAPGSIAHVPIPNAAACALSGNVLSVADPGAALHVINVLDVGHPELVGRVVTDATIDQLVANGTIVFGRAEFGIACFDVSEPLRPVLLAHGTTAIGALQVGAGKVWALTQDGGLAIVELAATFAATTFHDGQVEVRWHGPGMRLEYRDDGAANWIEIPGCDQTNHVRLTPEAPARIFRLVTP